MEFNILQEKTKRQKKPLTHKPLKSSKFQIILFFLLEISHNFKESLRLAGTSPDHLAQVPVPIGSAIPGCSVMSNEALAISMDVN